MDSVNDLTLEGGEKVPADVELEEKADITPSPPAEASVIDNANSSESTNEGADSPTTSTDKDSTESVESTSVVEDQTGSSVDEGNLLAESAADTTVAGNVSAEEIREDVRTGRIDGEPQQVLNDVQAERVSRETSEDSHDEL